MLILSATLAIFVYGLIAPILGALLPSYPLTPSQQGNLGMAQALGLVIASLSAGPVIDRRGNRLALVTGLILIVASLVAAPNAGGYGGLLFAYFVLGIGGGVVVTGANALVGAVEPTRRGSALNFLNLFFGLGGIITTYAASYLLTPVVLCYSVAALTFIALVVNAATRMPGPSREAGFRLNEVPLLLSRPALILLCLFLFLYVACEVGVWNWLKAYLISARFDSRSAGGVVSYGFAFGILLGRVVVSRVLIKVPALTVTLISAILMAITTYAMLHLESQRSITIAVFCAGLTMAPVFPTTLAIVGDTFHRGAATALGIVITCGWIGLAVSSPIIGSLAENQNYRRGLMLLPLFSVVMVLVNLALRPVLRRHVTA
ncbi:MAG: MFS transporter [Acidobacteriaceae bacterium]|nr:MFS transporter [Acidobacteriaceae bacterium]MBV9779336.1 MFS transporter [Acidobacteriaceae bacterium]